MNGTPTLTPPYHVDGTYHHKLTHRGRIVKISPPEQKVPLASITAKEQLLGTAAFYADDTMNRLPPFTPDGRADTTVVLGQSVFGNIRCAAFNSYILHRNHESAFLRGAYSSYGNGSFMLIAGPIKGSGVFVSSRAFAESESSVQTKTPDQFIPHAKDCP